MTPTTGRGGGGGRKAVKFSARLLQLRVFTVTGHQFSPVTVLFVPVGATSVVITAQLDSCLHTLLLLCVCVCLHPFLQPPLDPSSLIQS